MPYFKAKSTKFDCGWGPPQTRWRSYQRSPDKRIFKLNSSGPTSEGKGEKGMGKGRGRAPLEQGRQLPNVGHSALSNRLDGSSWLLA